MTKRAAPRPAKGGKTQGIELQAQRDLNAARLAELNAIIAYNRSLVNFEAVQLVPLAGR